MTNYLRLFFFVLGIFLPVMLLAQIKASDKAGEKKDAPKIKFPAIKDYNLTLEVVSPEREFYAEETAKFSFRLENKDSKKIIIYEWMMKEGDNITLYCKPYDGKFEKFVESEWKCIKPNVKENPRRASLLLNQNNAVFVEKELDFAKEVAQSDLAKGGKKFYVIGSLNLNSVSLKSQPVVIKIK
jgi:hypothetical protein